MREDAQHGSLDVRRCIGGVVPPIVTPLTEEGLVDADSLLGLAHHLVGAGATGIFALGSTGEASYLARSDQENVVRTLSSDSTLGVPLLVGVVETTAKRVVEQIDAMSAYPVSAFVVSGPFYALASPDEVRRHFEYIAERSASPILAYNIPVNTGYSLPADVMTRLIADGAIIGVKDSSPELGGFRQVIAGSTGCGAEPVCFTGSDSLFDLALAMGANGAVAGLSNVAPELFVAGLASHAARDHARLAKVQTRITTLTRIYAPYSPIHGVNSTQLGSIKTALVLQGLIGSDQVTAPMRRSTKARVAQVREVLVDAGVLDG